MYEHRLVSPENGWLIFYKNEPDAVLRDKRAGWVKLNASALQGQGGALIMKKQAKEMDGRQSA